MNAIRHAEGLTDEPIEGGSANVGRPRGLPSTANLGGYLLLAGLRGIKSASHEKQVLQSRFTGPGAQDAIRLTGLRLTANQCSEYLAPAITRGRTVTRRV